MCWVHSSLPVCFSRFGCFLFIFVFIFWLKNPILLHLSSRHLSLLSARDRTDQPDEDSAEGVTGNHGSRAEASQCPPGRTEHWGLHQGLCGSGSPVGYGRGLPHGFFGGRPNQALQVPDALLGLRGVTGGVYKPGSASERLSLQGGVSSRARPVPWAHRVRSRARSVPWAHKVRFRARSVSPQVLLQSPLRSRSPRSQLQSPLHSVSPQVPFQSPLRSGSPRSPLQSPLRSVSPQSPLQSLLRSVSPQSPLQNPLRSGSPRSPLHSGSPRSLLRSWSLQSPLQSLPNGLLLCLLHPGTPVCLFLQALFHSTGLAHRPYPRSASGPAPSKTFFCF